MNYPRDLILSPAGPEFCAATVKGNKRWGSGLRRPDDWD